MLCFTYGLSSILCISALIRILQISDKRVEQFLLIGWGLGPLSIAWCLELMLRFLPGHSDFAYKVGILTIFGGIGIVGFRRLPDVVRAIRSLLDRMWRHKLPWQIAPICLFFTILLVLGYAFALGLTQKLTGEDQLEYARLAQVFYYTKSLAMFPVLEPNSTLGYALGGFHPVAYPVFVTWHHIIAGSSTAYGYARLIDPMCLTMAAASLFGAFLGRPAIFGTMAAFLFVATPRIFGHTVTFHIDPFRIFAFQMDFALLCFALEQRTWRTWLLAGVAVGLDMNSHSTAILAPAIAAVCIMIGHRTAWRKGMAIVAVVIGVALLFGGHRYLNNTLTLGVPISDLPGMWKINVVEQENFLRVTRQISTPIDRIQYGLLRPFFEPQFFGWIFWLLPFAIFAFRWKEHRTMWAKVCLVVVLSYFTLATLSLLGGGTTFIKNFRYFLTIQPMAASLAAYFLGSVYARFFPT